MLGNDDDLAEVCPQVGQYAEEELAVVLDVVVGPHVAQAKESARPLYPLEKACAVFVRAELPLHVGHAAVGKRIVVGADADDLYPAIDETDIVFAPLFQRRFAHVRAAVSRYGRYRTNRGGVIMKIGMFPIVPIIPTVPIVPVGAVA